MAGAEIGVGPYAITCHRGRKAIDRQTDERADASSTINIATSDGQFQGRAAVPSGRPVDCTSPRARARAHRPPAGHDFRVVTTLRRRNRSFAPTKPPIIIFLHQTINSRFDMIAESDQSDCFAGRHALLLRAIMCYCS